MHYGEFSSNEKILKKVENEFQGNKTTMVSRIRKVVSKKEKKSSEKKSVEIPRELIRKRLFIYARVSTKGQGLKNMGHTSLDVQKDVCLKKGLENGFKQGDVFFFEDTFSAKDITKMPQFNKMLRQLQRGDTVYFYAVSRFSRDVEQGIKCLAELRKKGVSYYFCSEGLSSGGSASSRMTINTMLVTAQFEREQLGERIQASIKKRREMGSHLGRAPFGYRHKRCEDGKLILEMDVNEQKALEYAKKKIKVTPSKKDVFDLSDLMDNIDDSDDEKKPRKGAKKAVNNYGIIAKELNDQGYTLRSGKPWTASSLRYHLYK